MIKGGITQIGMEQRIAYPFSHLVSFILSNLVRGVPRRTFVRKNVHIVFRKKKNETKKKGKERKKKRGEREGKCSI